MIEIMKKVANCTDRIDLSDTFKPANSTSAPTTSYINSNFDLFITFDASIQMNTAGCAAILHIDASPVAIGCSYSSYQVSISWNGFLPKGHTLTYSADTFSHILNNITTGAHASTNYANSLTTFLVHAYKI